MRTERLFRGIVLLLSLCVLPAPAVAQTLRFGNHRAIQVPEYATVIIGPMFSDWTFSQEAGFRYTRSSGAGTDFLFANRRGTILEDGLEYPLISTLNLRNYLILASTTDIDFSLRVSYAHYPMKTQEDQFSVDLAEEGIEGTLSTEYEITPFLKASIYDRMFYKTDYIDTRGLSDPYGGQRYMHFDNTIGADTDWLLREDMNGTISFSRGDFIPTGDTFKEQQRVSWNEMIGFEQLLFIPMMKYGVNAAFNQNEYPATNWTGSSFQNYSVFSEIRLTERSVGQVSAGYSIGGSSSPSDASGNSKDSEVMTGSASVQTKFSASLQQTVLAQRGLRRSFNAPFEVYDNFSYRADWKGDMSAVSVFSELGMVEPGGTTNAVGYENWRSGINMTYPLMPGVNLDAASEYNVVKNNIEAGDNPAEPEWLYDYNTWASRVGTTFSIIQPPAGERGSALSFTLYAQHVVRTSKSEELTYTRDTVAGIFTWTHDF